MLLACRRGPRDGHGSQTCIAVGLASCRVFYSLSKRTEWSSLLGSQVPKLSWKRISSLELGPIRSLGRYTIQRSFDITIS